MKVAAFFGSDFFATTRKSSTTVAMSCVCGIWKRWPSLRKCGTVDKFVLKVGTHKSSMLNTDARILEISLALTFFKWNLKITASIIIQRQHFHSADCLIWNVLTEILPSTEEWLLLMISWSAIFMLRTVSVSFKSTGKSCAVRYSIMNRCTSALNRSIYRAPPPDLQWRSLPDLILLRCKFSSKIIISLGNLFHPLFFQWWNTKIFASQE